MIKLLKTYSALLLSAWALSTTALGADQDAAQVTLTITQFRPMNPVANTDFVDATTELVPHSAVTLVTIAGMPTFRVKRAINFEIRLASAQPGESYRPLGVIFRQKTDRAISQPDPAGLRYFASSITANGTLVIQNKFLQRGDDGRYEFYVLVQRVSDGAVGMIDPDIDNQNNE